MILRRLTTSVLLVAFAKLAVASELLHNKPGDGRQGLSPNDEWGCQLARISRLGINSGFASCTSTEKKSSITDICTLNPKSVQNFSTRSCRTQSPIYSLGHKHKIFDGEKVDSAPNGQIDCSGFVGSVLCRAGARLRPNDDSCGPPNTEEFLKMGDGNDCFKVAEFTSMQSLRPGCLVVWRDGRRGHVFMVGRASTDPFGLTKEAAKENDCKSSDISNFDFEVSESVPGRALSSRPASERFATDANPRILALKRLACSARNSGVAKTADLQDKDGAHLKVLCHVGSEKPNCLGSPRVYKNEECVSQCSN